MSIGTPTADRRREARLEHVSTQLLPRASLLTRLLFARELGGSLTRSEAGVLNTLSVGPRRITELAELEGLAQPTMTLIVKRLEDQRLVARGRDADDGRVVIASLTPAGSDALESFRAGVAEVMREHLIDMSDRQIEALATAADALQDLIAQIQA